MHTLSYRPDRDCVNSLGIPVDNLTLSSAVERIVRMARIGDGRARLVSTLNVDFLVNCLGAGQSRPRHPELLNVLRSADLVTADGFPIVWLSRLLGRPLSGRVCGSDLAPALAERCAREGLSIFLLGGGAGSAAQAARILGQRYPGLRIAGSAAPRVHTAGSGLASVQEDDRALLAQIHGAGADILLLGLGNPKQELWFNRNRAQLAVAVSIGVGGTFEFITGTVRRAPALWQRLNLEWVYRIGQDPGRLWKRYGKGLFKLALLAWPVLVARVGEGLSRGRESPAPQALPWRRLWSSRDQSITLLTLPPRPGRAYLAMVNRELHGHSTAGALRIVDLSRVRRIALHSQPELFNLAGLLRAQRGQLQLMGLSARLRKQLAAARLLDLFSSDGPGDDEGALDRVTRRPTDFERFSCRSFSLSNATLVTLAGQVDGASLRALGFVECLLPAARDRPCIIDLRNVDLLESSAIAELLPLLSVEAGPRGRVCLSGVSYRTRQMLRMAAVPCAAEIIDDSELLARIAAQANDV